MPEPLILLPGLACDATLWSHQQCSLGAARRVTIADYGDTASLGAMADRVLADAPDRFALAGHSMGARVALEMITRAPDRIIRLALLDTGVHPVRPGEADARQALLYHGRDAGIAALVARWLPPMVHPARRADAAVMAPLTAMAMRFGVAGFARHIGALLSRRDATPLLDAITCPVLFGVGAQDEWSSPDQHRDMAARIPGAVLTVFDDSGHMAPFEVPGPVTAALSRWLAQPVAD